MTRRLMALAAMVVLVAASNPAGAEVVEVGMIANALEPTRTSIPRISTSEPSVIRDESITSTGAIPMYATIGRPSVRRSPPARPPLQEEPVRPVDPKEPAESIESVEQRTYTADVEASVAHLQFGLNTLFSIQGLESTAQMSLTPSTGTAMMLFVESDDAVVAVVSLSTRDGGSAVEATWTDQ